MLNLIIATLVLLRACNVITDAVVFYLLPNGMSALMWTKRNEKDCRTAMTVYYSICSLTVHCSLPTDHWSRPTTHYPLPTAYYPLPTGHCPLITGHYPLPTAPCPLVTAWNGKVNRSLAFAALCMKTAIASQHFNVFCSAKDGKLRFVDLVQMFGSVNQVGLSGV